MSHHQPPSSGRRLSHGRRGLIVLFTVGLAACTTSPPTAQDTAGAGPEGKPPPATATPQPRPSPATSPSTTPGSAPADGPRPVDAGALVERFTVQVRGGKVQPTTMDIEVPVGDTIEIAVTSDVPATLRAEGLEVTHELESGLETIVPMTVKAPGSYEVTLDQTLLAVITATS